MLTRGPLHEAFAEPVVYDPRPGPVVPKEPPQLVEEAPPEQKPEGVNIAWIPGYWAWDDGRNDFIWISGLWRDVPPGREWVPGYWAEAANGFRWVPGAWAAIRAGDPGTAAQVEYLSVPPQSLEAGPNSPAPSPGAGWSPGYWFWSADRYVWRPGFWVAYQAEWVWVPAHYVWTPGGYLFVNGYWDRPIASRGTPFAPVYFATPVYQQPRYVYTPTISLLATALASSLFVRPANHQYYFGDYYAASNFQSGIYPWYSFHQSRYGYDPVFAHYSVSEVRRDPQWLDHLHDEYGYRRDHPEARPPHTYAEMRRVSNNTNVNNVNTVNTVNNVNNIRTTVNQKTVNITRNLVLARPVSQVAANPEGQPLRYTRINEQSRRELGQQSQELQKFRQQRLRQEMAAARPREAARPNDLPPQGPAANPAVARPLPQPRPETKPQPRPQRPPEAQGQPFPERPRRVNQARSPIGGEPRRGPGAAAGAVAQPAPPLPTGQPPSEPNARPQAPGQPALRQEPHPEMRPRTFPGQFPNLDARPRPQPSPRPQPPKAQLRQEIPKAQRPPQPKAQLRQEIPKAQRPPQPPPQPLPQPPPRPAERAKAQQNPQDKAKPKGNPKAEQRDR